MSHAKGCDCSYCSWGDRAPAEKPARRNALMFPGAELQPAQLIEDAQANAAVHDGDRNDADWFDVPRCPWCGVAERDWWDFDRLRSDDGTTRIDCGSCEESYMATVRMDPKFKTWRL